MRGENIKFIEYNEFEMNRLFIKRNNEIQFPHMIIILSVILYFSWKYKKEIIALSSIIKKSSFVIRIKPHVIESNCMKPHKSLRNFNYYTIHLSYFPLYV